MPRRPDFRRVAYVVWGALVLGALAFAAVASYVGPALRSPDEAGSLLPEAALAFAVLAVVGSRILPRLLRPAPGLAPEAFAITRHLVALALCEAAAVLGVVAWMLTGRTSAAVGAAIGLVGMISCFPGDARWRSLLAADARRGGTGGPRRMIR